MRGIKRSWKKNTAVVLSLLLTLGLLPLPAQAAEKAAASYGEYQSGSGNTQKRSEEGYEVISLRTEEELARFAEQCRLDSWSADKKAVLENDIALSEYMDISIPVFSGIFDGNGYRITNLRLTGKGSVQGLFRYLQEGGVIRNLNVEGKAAPEGSQSRVGGIVGINYGTILNCSFGGSVSGDNEIGGIAGVNEASGEIRRCSSGAIVIGNHSTGGITGVNHGALNNCVNTGDINTYSTEVTMDIMDLTIENLEDLNSTANVAAHTDSGGIAGISDGKIYYCTNSGSIGYPHVGYNSGGIVGRLSQGYIQNCTNTGHVMGRKDVGGIAGQMEPFLEITYLNDKLSELDAETDILIDLLDALHQDVSGYGRQASTLSKEVTVNLKNVSSAAGSLTGLGNELFYLYNQELTAMSNDGRILDEELKVLDGSGKEPDGGFRPSVSSGDVQDAIDKMIDNINGSGDSTIDSKSDIDANEPNVPDTGQNGENNDSSDTNNGSDMNNGENNFKPVIPDNTEAYKAALEKFGRNVTGHLGNMANGTGDRSQAVKSNLDILNKEMQASADHLSRLADVLQAGGDKAGEDVDAVVEQAKVLRRLISEIRDELFSYEGITVEDTSDEAASTSLTDVGAQEAQDAAGTGKSGTEKSGAGQSGTGQSGTGQSGTEKSGTDKAKTGQSGTEQAGEAQGQEKLYDTSSFQKGKITRSINKGFIEADTNVGGIVGQIATEYDFDPEDDITLTGKESFDIEQTVKAVVRESRNLGDVTGKKDCAGGIAGKADFGAIISCESYGSISSTDGGYVGGIAGISSYAIRGCYSMGALHGTDNIGGIAGQGSDIFYCRAYNEIDREGERAGAIAGGVREKGSLYGNYYVGSLGEQNAVGGVDGVSYAVGAEPLAYEAFCGLPELPEAFRAFTVTFLIDGKEAASYPCAYGDALTADQIPAIPEREGYYGAWPEYDFDYITGNKVLEARYEKWIGSLASAETGENGMPLLLAEGEFLPGAGLALETDGEQTTFSVTGNGDDGEKNGYTGALTVRALCPDNAEGMTVEVLSDGSFRPVESSVKGSYMLFSMAGPGSFRLVSAQKQDYTVWILPGAALAGVALIFVVGRRIRRRKER